MQASRAACTHQGLSNLLDTRRCLCSQETQKKEAEVLEESFHCHEEGVYVRVWEKSILGTATMMRLALHFQVWDSSKFSIKFLRF